VKQLRNLTVGPSSSDVIVYPKEQVTSFFDVAVPIFEVGVESDKVAKLV
jgi:hypothetical protein